VDSPSLTLLVLFLIHALLQSLVAAQHFFSVNLANFSSHLLLLLNILNCLQSQSNFLTLIWLYIHRPPQSKTKSRHSVSFSQFLEDFQTLISSVSTSYEFLITGDFNIHVDDHTNSNAIQFLSLLDHANLTQHVLFPTHRHCHTLDLVITSDNSTLSPTVISFPISPTDHLPIICSLKITNSPTAPMTKHLTRAIHY